MNRILELEVASFLVEASKRLGINVTNGAIRKDQGGPDFKIEYPDGNIFIECVCANQNPDDPEVSNVKKECIIEEEELEVGGMRLPSQMQTGSDKRKVARISSVIADKAEKIKKYREKNIIKDNDIIILIISPNFIFSWTNAKTEFEETIGDKCVVQIQEKDGNNSVIFEENNKGIFEKQIKNGNSKDRYEKIKAEKKDLDQFNVFVLANNGFLLKNFHGRNTYFEYAIYIRQLPINDLCKQRIEDIFQTQAQEYSRHLYRIDNHPRCNEKAIAKDWNSRKGL